MISHEFGWVLCLKAQGTVEGHWEYLIWMERGCYVPHPVWQWAFSVLTSHDVPLLSKVAAHSASPSLCCIRQVLKCISDASIKAHVPELLNCWSSSHRNNTPRMSSVNSGSVVVNLNLKVSVVGQPARSPGAVNVRVRLFQHKPKTVFIIYNILLHTMIKGESCVGQRTMVITYSSYSQMIWHLLRCED